PLVLAAPLTATSTFSDTPARITLTFPAIFPGTTSNDIPFAHRIYRRDTRFGVWLNITGGTAALQDVGPQGTTFVDTNVLRGTLYEYRIEYRYGPIVPPVPVDFFTACLFTAAGSDIPPTHD